MQNDSDDLYPVCEERSLPGKRMYLFFDELQRMAGWENTISRFAWIWIATSIITGSNAYLLSEYSTYLSGRCVEIKCCRCRLQSLSISMVSLFKEGSKARSAVQKGRQLMPTVPITSCVEIFDAYMRYGGMPGIADVRVGTGQGPLTLLDGILFDRYWCVIF